MNTVRSRPNPNSTVELGSECQTTVAGTAASPRNASVSKVPIGSRAASASGFTRRTSRSAQFVICFSNESKMPVTHIVRITSPARLPAVRCIQKKYLRLDIGQSSSDSGFCPASHQVVVDTGELDGRRVLRKIAIEFLNCYVQIE